MNAPTRSAATIEVDCRSPDIDRIKALAIVAIMWLHYFGQPMEWHNHWISSDQFIAYWRSFSWAKLLRFTLGFGHLGVNLFVIASGFGLQFSALNKPSRPSYLQFLRRRYSRLLPQAILASAIVWLIKSVLLADTPNSNLLLNILPFLAGINLFTDATFYPPINGELWFLGLMVQLYILFPLFVWALDRVGTSRFLIALFLVSICFRLCYALWLRHYVVNAAYGWCFGRLFEFGFGMCVARGLKEGRSLSRFWTLGLCLFWGYFWWWSFPFADALLGVGLFSWIWTELRNCPDMAFVGYLSARSYSLFLIHHPLIWMFNNLGIRDAWTTQGCIGFGLLFLFSIGLSEIIDMVIADASSFRTAVAYVTIPIFLYLGSMAPNPISEEQESAIDYILRQGGAVQREKSGFGSVVSIRLEGRAFNDSHVEYLLRFPRVTKVSLYGADITDATIARLAGLEELRELGLQETKITGASIDRLASMARLRYVWLSNGRSISDADIRHLKEVRPDLIIYY